jgi:hypothetical protein
MYNDNDKEKKKSKKSYKDLMGRKAVTSQGMSVKSIENCQIKGGKICGPTEKSTNNFDKPKYRVPPPIAQDEWVREKKETDTKVSPPKVNVKHTKTGPEGEEVIYPMGSLADYEKRVNPKQREILKENDPTFYDKAVNAPSKITTTETTSEVERKKFARGVNPGKDWVRAKEYDKNKIK